MPARRRSVATAILLPLIVGLIGFINLTHHPRFAAFHAVDVLQLLATGMCFGVALSALIVLIRNRTQA
jgi:hypothetical protein